MPHTVELFFDDTINKEIVNLIPTQDIANKYQLKVEQLEPPAPNTGGDMWSGAALFISGAIAGGFLGELGKDIYKYLKEKLFQIKKKITFPDTFLIIIRDDAYFLTFDTQNIQTDEELNKALSEIADIVNNLNQGLKIAKFFLRLFRKQNSTFPLVIDRNYEYDSKQKIWKIIKKQ